MHKTISKSDFLQKNKDLIYKKKYNKYKQKYLDLKLKFGGMFPSLFQSRPKPQTQSLLFQEQKIDNKQTRDNYYQVENRLHQNPISQAQLNSNSIRRKNHEIQQHLNNSDTFFNRYGELDITDEGLTLIKYNIEEDIIKKYDTEVLAGILVNVLHDIDNYVVSSKMSSVENYLILCLIQRQGMNIKMELADYDWKINFHPEKFDHKYIFGPDYEYKKDIIIKLINNNINPPLTSPISQQIIKRFKYLYDEMLKLESHNSEKRNISNDSEKSQDDIDIGKLPSIPLQRSNSR